MGYNDLRFELRKRPTGNAYKTRKLRLTPPNAPLCDIGRNGYSRTPHLVGQTKYFLFRKELRGIIDTIYQYH